MAARLRSETVAWLATRRCETSAAARSRGADLLAACGGAGGPAPPWPPAAKMAARLARWPLARLGRWPRGARLSRCCETAARLSRCCEKDDGQNLKHSPVSEGVESRRRSLMDR